MLSPARSTARSASGDLGKLNVEGRKAKAIVTQLLEHPEGQNVFSKVVIEAASAIPAWFIDVIQEADIAVEVLQNARRDT